MVPPRLEARRRRRRERRRHSGVRSRGSARVVWTAWTPKRQRVERRKLLLSQPQTSASSQRTKDEVAPPHTSEFNINAIVFVNRTGMEYVRSMRRATHVLFQYKYIRIAVSHAPRRVPTSDNRHPISDIARICYIAVRLNRPEVGAKPRRAGSQGLAHTGHRGGHGRRGVRQARSSMRDHCMSHHGASGRRLRTDAPRAARAHSNLSHATKLGFRVETQSHDERAPDE